MNVDKFVVALNSLQPIIVCNIHEEMRFRVSLFTALGKAEEPRMVTRVSPSSITRWQFGKWDNGEAINPTTTGLAKLLEETREAKTKRTDADRKVADIPRPEVFWIANYDDMLAKELAFQDMLAEAALDFQNKPGKVLLLTGTSMKVPDMLKPLSVMIDSPLPSKAEIEELVECIISKYKETGFNIKIDQKALKEFKDNVRGLTEEKIKSTFNVVVATEGKFTTKGAEIAREAKRDEVKQSGILEVRPVRLTLKDVGGLGFLKTWIEEISAAFTDPEKFKAYGLRVPSGILTIGPPGTGKSMVCEAIAGSLGISFARFNIGNCLDRLMGESEAKLRMAFRVMEALAPVVIQLDEVEKMLGATDTHNATHGIMKGMLLTWLEEKPEGVFVSMTCNDAAVFNQSGNNALVRDRRIDATFFVDLPAMAAREEIFDIHLRLTGHSKASSEIQKRINGKNVIDLTHGFSGAEIETVVQAALRLSLKDGLADPVAKHLCEAAAAKTSQYVAMRESIEALRRWVKEGRAKPAGEMLEGAGVNGADVAPSLGRVKSVVAPPNQNQN